MAGQLLLTRQALEAHLPQICETRGERLSVLMHPGMVDGPEGYREFDQEVHNAEDIDFEAPDTEYTGEDYVRITSKPLPHYMNIAGDLTPRLQTQAITDTKLRVARTLAGLLGGALQSQGDEDYFFLIGQPSAGKTAEAGPIADKVFEADDRTSVPDAAATITSYTGMPFIVSDFRAVRFDSGSLDRSVAIKINHLVERSLPANIGIISLGGSVELDTRDSYQLAAYNARLEAEHQSIVGNLAAAGAEVVSVVADPRLKPDEFDGKDADRQIAAAIMAIAKKA